MYVLDRTQRLDASLEEVFAFFAEASNLARITPPWLRFRIREAPDQLALGSHLRYRLRLFGIPIGWRTEIVEWSPPVSFTDVQRRGPFLLWEHTHRLTPVDGGTEIYDRVRYRLFLGPLGVVVRRLLVRGWVEGIFDYRAEALGPLLSGPAPDVQPRRTA